MLMCQETFAFEVKIRRRVLVCGSRTMRRVHMHLIRRELESVPKDFVVVHGAQGVFHPVYAEAPRPTNILYQYSSARSAYAYVESGADMLADEVARELGLVTEPHPADWRLGGRAGPLRNIEMLESGVDLVLAFHDGRSPGTAHALREAARMSIPTRVVRFTP